MHMTFVRGIERSAKKTNALTRFRHWHFEIICKRCVHKVFIRWGALKTNPQCKYLLIQQTGIGNSTVEILTTLLGCIADDFTGATDLAGLLARSGVKVSLRIGVPNEPPKDTAAFEIIALKTRTWPVSDAVNECLSALNWLQKTGAEQFFWKYCSTFDSTAEGNIGPVAEALMAELNCEQTIYCPAFPENGRSIYMGNLFVEEHPLAESSMKDHPLTPMRDSNLMRLLKPQVTKPVGLVNRLAVARGGDVIKSSLDSLKKEGVAHVVVDAVADADLEAIAHACQNMPLITGGSALAMPLPYLYIKNGELSELSAQRVTPQTGNASIVLSGSCSAMTRQQVATYIQTTPSFKLDPIMIARDGVAAALGWLEDQPMDVVPILYATAEPEDVAAAQAELGLEMAGDTIEQALADIAVAACAKGIRRFLVAGGETSGAVTKALDISTLDVGDEIAPGVPWCFSNCGGNSIAIALKSGNFGKETFFADALKMLDEI